ncbi:hypothetical protein W97_00984 [Coniosporium apollinis CBS 100218]|uniref:Phytocyanin domain-containing protein n=1 Tax=Coniosporium apollinis (strain CBS 100218) TaxID=1168221 RepID=R7YIQ4_CONA1|nr:uncharacterized protein W97_00984 [Coniosporium apollinis CBS 100218]EON61768.1 hypothetical protein W97_00984 [Coniosporium apollinis CBS 100218]
MPTTTSSSSSISVRTPIPVNEFLGCTEDRPVATHTVSVGGIAHQFTPDRVLACKDDVVKFDFFPTNHSVVRADFDHPCVPYEMVGNNQGGFFSGFRATDKIEENPSSWLLRVDSRDPVFFYCSAPGSCKDWAMVGAINPTAQYSLAEHALKARAADQELSPGEKFRDEASSPTNTDASNDVKDHPHSLSKGAIAGITIGVVVVVFLAGGFFFYMGRVKTLKKSMERTNATVPHPATRHMSGASLVFPHAPFGEVPQAHFSESPQSRLSGVALSHLSAVPQPLFSETPHARFSELPAPVPGLPTYAESSSASTVGSASPKSPDRYFRGFLLRIPSNPPPPPPPPPPAELWAPVPDRKTT